MSDLRAPGNPGGSRGKNNPIPQSGPRSMENSDAKAPAGETKFGSTPKQAGANKRNVVH